MDNKIILCKLVSGEEIIGILKNVDQYAMVISKPRVLSVQPQNGQMAVMMIPFLMGMPDADVSIYMDKVMGEHIGELSSEIEDGYRSQISDIALPPKSRIKL